MKNRPRCDRGHFLPAGAWPGTPCAHIHTTACMSIRADLRGQGVSGRRLARMTTVQLAGSWL